MSAVTNERHDTPVIKLNQPDDSHKFRPLPKPSGRYPYHLPLEDIQAASDQKLVFHMVGDTGGILNPDFQSKVAAEMSRQFNIANVAHDSPQFLYHLGDIVYHHGEAEHYYQQFFAPYRQYPAPVFAIAGNHDSDINPDNKIPYQSLDAFIAVFCDTASRKINFCGDTGWKSMVQPNVYWTLQTPLANIIGLYSNTPKYGVIENEQRNWFIEELKAAGAERPGKAILVCLHHAPYTADINHGSSLPMISFLEEAFEESGVRADIVFSGHVHNYQRFHKQYPDGKILPFIVAGAGGFDQLHSIATIDNPAFSAQHPLLQDVKLENYCENKHGFLKISLSRVEAGINLTGEYYTIPHQLTVEGHAELADRFNFCFDV
ncbi:metallophosphoesterase family protein [Desertivirga xinjiangensis]|uniref:metallophosphoesterase family protein n=1 Tax=Desertivirga xinjiangensis TaxID=539206 RepID=UPI00210BCC8F|nr:metallophosphoesterase [Pedobacter xinjiangensis]